MNYREYLDYRCAELEQYVSGGIKQRLAYQDLLSLVKKLQIQEKLLDDNKTASRPAN